jgi:hypothetical protein
MPVSTEVRRGLEVWRELAEETQHSGQARGAVRRHGFLQKQGRMHGNNLGQSSCRLYSQGIQMELNKIFHQNKNVSWYRAIGKEEPRHRHTSSTLYFLA